MRTLIKTLKSLYKKSKITKEYLMGKVEDKTITVDEYNYIVGFEE